MKLEVKDEIWKDIENYPNYEISISNCVNGYSKTAGGFIWKR